LITKEAPTPSKVPTASDPDPAYWNLSTLDAEYDESLPSLPTDMWRNRLQIGGIRRKIKEREQKTYIAQRQHAQVLYARAQAAQAEEQASAGAEGSPAAPGPSTNHTATMAAAMNMMNNAAQTAAATAAAGGELFRMYSRSAHAGAVSKSAMGSVGKGKRMGKVLTTSEWNVSNDPVDLACGGADGEWLHVFASDRRRRVAFHARTRTYRAAKI
jgi:hypothetical protein